MSMPNLHESAPTRFQEVGYVRLAYRRVREGGGTASGLPSAFHRHDEQLGSRSTLTAWHKTAPCCSWTTGAWAGRAANPPDSMPGIARHHRVHPHAGRRTGGSLRVLTRRHE